MALTGIRDLSWSTPRPPTDGPILTYVGEDDDAAVSEAIRRELLREGQVFYVHNRVADIEAVARRLRALVPEARIAVAHGQMDEGTPRAGGARLLGAPVTTCWCAPPSSSRASTCPRSTPWWSTGPTCSVWASCTRSGAGWAGRSQRAYAYLFHPADRVLTEQAYERLRTIGEHTELGSGFKIAMRDLEIRGAGNLLGADQSGHIAAVGYDLYVQLVAEAVAEARGEARPEPPSVSLDVPGDAHLPADYVAAEDARLEAYRRLAVGGHRGRRRRRGRGVARPLRAPAGGRPRGSWRWPGCGWSACAPGSPRWRSRRPGWAGPASRSARLPRCACRPAPRSACGDWPRAPPTGRSWASWWSPLAGPGAARPRSSSPCWATWRRPRRRGHGAAGAAIRRPRGHPVACPRMKRLLALLVVIAALLAVAAVSDPVERGHGQRRRRSPSPPSTPTSPPSASSAGYQCYLNAEVAVQTSGQSPAITVYGVGQRSGQPPDASR